MIMKIPTNMYGSGGGNYHNDAGYDIDFEVASNDSDLINDEDDFSEYMWMQNEEEFDKLEMQRLEDEAVMQQCYEIMLEDELEEEAAAAAKSIECSQELSQVLSALSVSSHIIAEKSKLNPLAAEFVPQVRLVEAST